MLRLLATLIVALTVFSQVPAQAEGPTSSLTIYVYPPRQPLNWKSPRRLLESFLDISIQRTLRMNEEVKFTSDFGEPGSISSNYISTMGHTIAHVQCTLPNGRAFNRWSSFSGQDSREVDKRNTFTNKLGLGMLFYDYVDGHIIAGPENYKRLVHYNGKSGSPRYIEFGVDANHCARLKKMIDFFESFHFPAGTDIKTLEARDPEKILYFNTMDPYETYVYRQRTGRGRVGGGCAPYGAALVKMAGWYSPLFEKSWRRPVPVSEKLIGGIPDAATGQLRKVSVRKLLFTSLGGSWTHDGYANRSLSLYDPQMIWDFVGETDQCVDGAPGCSPQAQEWLSGVRGRVTPGPEHIYSDEGEVVRIRGLIVN